MPPHLHLGRQLGYFVRYDRALSCRDKDLIQNNISSQIVQSIIGATQKRRDSVFSVCTVSSIIYILRRPFHVVP